MVSAIDFKNLFDSLTDEELVGELTSRAIKTPGYFFSIVTIRSIGKRRIERMQKVAYMMCAQAENKKDDIYIVGVFLARVIEEFLKVK